MKKNSIKRNHSDFDDNYGVGKHGSVPKDKSSKKKLSIYDEYADEDDDFAGEEKFKTRKKH